MYRYPAGRPVHDTLIVEGLQTPHEQPKHGPDRLRGGVPKGTQYGTATTGEQLARCRDRVNRRVVAPCGGVADVSTSVLSAPPDRIQRPDVTVMEHSTADELAHIQQIWPCFERLVGLRGRKRFARVDERAGTYTVCTPVKDNDQPQQLGLTLGTLAGGWYLRGQLTGQPDEIYRRIGNGMTELKAIAATDDTCPLVEVLPAARSGRAVGAHPCLRPGVTVIFVAPKHVVLPSLRSRCFMPALPVTVSETSEATLLARPRANADPARSLPCTG